MKKKQIDETLKYTRHERDESRRYADELEARLYEAAKIIRRLLSYADRTAENHPRAVTGAGQNARVRAGLWLAKFERENADNPKVKAPQSQGEADAPADGKPDGQEENDKIQP